MNNTVKKLLALLLAVAMCLAFNACGGSAEPDTGDQSATRSGQESAEDDGEVRDSTIAEKIGTEKVHGAYIGGLPGFVAASIEQKGAPGVEGDIIIRILIDDEDENVKKIIYEIPDEEYDCFSAAELTGELREGYEKLIAARGLDEVCKNIGEALDVFERPDLTINDLVVRDLFEFRLYDTTRAQTVLDDKETNFVDVTFTYSIEEKDVFIVMEYLDGEWVALEPYCAIIHDGAVNIRLPQDGLLAFVIPMTVEEY